MYCKTVEWEGNSWLSFGQSRSWKPINPLGIFVSRFSYKGDRKVGVFAMPFVPLVPLLVFGESSFHSGVW